MLFIPLCSPLVDKPCRKAYLFHRRLFKLQHQTILLNRKPPSLFANLTFPEMMNDSSRFSLMHQCSALALMCLFASPAHAQETPAAVTEDVEDIVADRPINDPNNITMAPTIVDGKAIYSPAFFARFSPQTAIDMVEQIPGFSISNTSGDRGLGNASQNVLINGKRISGKSNDARTILGRLAASQIVQLEIVDGASLSIAGLNGQVLNVITTTKGISGNYRWRTQFRQRLPDNLLDAELNINAPLGKGELILGINNNGAFRNGNAGPEIVSDGDGNLLFIRESNNRFRRENPTISASYGVTGDGGSIFNIGGSFALSISRRDNDSPITGPDIAPFSELRAGSEDEINFELNSDYEFDFIGGRLKLIAFQRFEHSPNDNLFLQTFTDGSASEGSQFNTIQDEGESILRSELRWSGGQNDWQLSLEGAYNFLDRTSEFLVLDPDGIFQEEPLDNASARVEEYRGDASLSFSRPLSSTVNLQTIFGAEVSNISQDGASGLSRTFVRPKGSLALTWRPNSVLDINARIERRVGQLNFGSFLASVDIGNNGNSNSGNPLLVPPQSWVGEIELNRSLGDAGSIKLTLEAESISDLIDQVPIGLDAEAVGNVDGARRLNIGADATFLLDNIIGWKGAKLDIRAEYETSSVPDQIFDFRRSISRSLIGRYRVDFRHDIIGSNWAWGIEARDGRRNDNLRLDFLSNGSNNLPFTTIFVENKDVFGLRVNLQIQNLLNQTERREEIFFTERRDGPISTTESFRGQAGQFYRFIITGTF